MSQIKIYNANIAKARLRMFIIASILFISSIAITISIKATLITAGAEQTYANAIVIVFGIALSLILLFRCITDIVSLQMEIALLTSISEEDFSHHEAAFMFADKVDFCKELENNGEKIQTFKAITKMRAMQRTRDGFAMGLLVMGLFWMHFAFVLLILLSQEGIALMAAVVAAIALIGHEILYAGIEQLYEIEEVGGKQTR